MTGYTRQAEANIATGNIIQATDHNAEFNAIEAAFNESAGHNHDGTSGGGALISLISSITGTLPITNGGTNATTAAAARTNLGLVIGTDVQAYDAELAAIAGLTSDANKIIRFTGLGTADLLDFKDEDNMVSDSATALASQQSIKAYVDAQVASGGDMSTSTYDPGTISEQLVGLTAAQTLTNKTLTTPTLTLKQSASPTPTVEGDIQWDTDDNAIRVGDGSGTVAFSNDTVLASTYQPLDSDLTAIAALTTTSYGRGLLELADQSALQTAVNVEDGAQVNTVDSVNGATGVVVLDPDDLDDTSTTNKFTTASDISKLALIEANADVTDTTNVTAAGALMDSELTSEASVKALNQGVSTTDSPTFVTPVVKNVNEGVYAISGTTPAIDPGNGGIQTWTLSGNSTPTDSLSSGESVTLMIDDGTAYTVTWTSLVDGWIGGSAPTLPTSGYAVIELWKVGTSVYGAYVGDIS